MSVTSPVTGRVTGIVASGVTRAIGRRRRVDDAEALAYITAVEAADDEALEDGVKAAYIDFIDGCKADGIWTAIKASCILAGAKTLAGCLVPLVGTAPTNVGPFVSGDYSRTTGLKGNASTKYLDSNRNNNADPRNSNHNAVWVSTADSTGITSSYIDGGGTDSGANNFGRSSVVGNVFLRNRTSEVSTLAFGSATGLMGTSRTASSGYTFRASATSSSVLEVSEVPSSETIFLFARSGPTVITNARIAFYSIGESLNLENLDTRVTALMTAIGAAL